MSSIFKPNPGPFVLGWAPNHFVLGAQLDPGEKRLVCIPELEFEFSFFFTIIDFLCFSTGSRVDRNHLEPEQGMGRLVGELERWQVYRVTDRFYGDPVCFYL